MSAGSILTGAGTGAAAGSVLGPWGTAGGAIVGGVIGALTGGGGGGGTSTPPANPINFQYGQGNGSEYSNQIAAALANRGNAADTTGALLGSQAQGAYGMAASAQGIGAPQIQQDAVDRQRQIAALGGTNTSAANLTGAASQLQQMGTDGMPLGLAAAQLHQGADANMNQSLALAHSGRSLGGGAAALQAAQFANAQTGQVTNQQAAAANIQEQQQNQQYKLAALGASQQGYGSAGSLYGQAGTQAGGINQTDIGVQQTNAQLQQGQQGVNNQTSATFGQMGAGLNQAQLGEQQLGQGYQGQGIGVMNSQLAANGNLSSQSLGQGNTGVSNQIAANTQSNAQLASGLQSGAQIIAGYANAAGKPAATTPPVAAPATPAPAPAPSDADWQSKAGAAGDQNSDRNVKTDIQPANMALSLQPSPQTYALPSARLAALGGSPATLRQPGSLVAPPSYGAMPAPLAAPSPMPSGSPIRAAAPGMDPSAIGQFTGNGTSATAGPVTALPGADPYLAAMGGTNNMYLPGGIMDRKYNASQQNAADVANAPAVLAVVNSNLRANLEARSRTARPPAPGAWSMAEQVAGDPTKNPLSLISDVHSKTRIQELESQLAALRPQPPDTDALDAAYRSQGGIPVAPPAVDLRPARGYSYEYKDPDAHGQGRFYGPMAQDLEQTPAGASTVKQGPDGTKMVDTSRLSLVNTSAISEQQRKLEALQSQLAALTQPQMDQIQRGFPASYPTPQQPSSIDFSQAMARGGQY